MESTLFRIEMNVYRPMRIEIAWRVGKLADASLEAREDEFTLNLHFSTARLRIYSRMRCACFLSLQSEVLDSPMWAD